MKRLFVSGMLLFLLQYAYSQSDVVEFIKAGKDDANTLFQPYLKPYAYALGDGLGNGWYNSAESHKLLGFDLLVSVSAVKVPSSAKTFDLSALTLTKLQVVGTNTIAPTIAGAKEPGPTLKMYENNKEILSFESPQGAGVDIVPVPMVQVSAGLMPYTDVIVRTVPKIKISTGDDDTKINLFGLGIKHNFKEWMPLLKHLPFDAAVFAGFTNVNSESGITMTPADYGNQQDISVTFTPEDNQRLTIESKSVKVGLILSKKLGPLTLFGGVGETSSKTNVDLLGKYPIVTTLSTGALVISDEDALYDPISLKYDKRSNLSYEAGFRFKMAFFSLFASVGHSEYTSANAGFSFGLR